METLRPWERDGHPEIRDSAEAAAGGGQEPAGGESWSCGSGLRVVDCTVVVGGRVVVRRGSGVATGLTDLPLSPASCWPRASKGQSVDVKPSLAHFGGACCPNQYPLQAEG